MSWEVCLLRVVSRGCVQGDDWGWNWQPHHVTKNFSTSLTRNFFAVDLNHLKFSYPHLLHCWLKSLEIWQRNITAILQAISKFGMNCVQFRWPWFYWHMQTIKWIGNTWEGYVLLPLFFVHCGEVTTLTISYPSDTKVFSAHTGYQRVGTLPKWSRKIKNWSDIFKFGNSVTENFQWFVAKT